MRREGDWLRKLEDRERSEGDKEEESLAWEMFHVVLCGAVWTRKGGAVREGESSVEEGVVEERLASLYLLTSLMS